MGFLGDDPFDSILKEFFGAPAERVQRREHFIRSEDEDRTIDFIEDENNIYLIFELPGYTQEDISVTVKGRELEISAQKSNGQEIQEYLSQKLRQKVNLKRSLPEYINTKGLSYTFKNGILEIIFANKGKKR